MVQVYRCFLIAHLPVTALALVLTPASARKRWLAVLPPLRAVWVMLVAPDGTVPVLVAVPPRTRTATRRAGARDVDAGADTGADAGADAGSAAGGAVGVTASLASDALEEPTLFAAVTVKVYGVPAVRPVTVHVVAPVVVQVRPPGAAVAV